MATSVTARRGEPITYDDLRDAPDDGHRYEIVDGTLLVTPAPGAAHQSCVGRLFSLLDRARRAGEVVLIAPTDYVVSASTVLQPDLLVVRRAGRADRAVTETPLLVVEVLSPSTRRADLGTKRLAYQDAGVPGYWVVDPDEPSLTAFELAGSEYREVAHRAGTEAFTTTAPLAVTVVPADLVEGLEG
jgi:Uma2 family endonuclease